MIQKIKEFFFGEPPVIIDAKGGFYKMRYVIVYPDDDIWEAACPSLPGCYGFGKTKEQAIDNIRESIGEYIDRHWYDEDEMPPNVKPEIVEV